MAARRDGVLSERPSRRDDVIVVEIDDEAVVYDGRTGALHVLNHTAKELYLALDGSLSVDELVTAAAAAAGLPAKAVEVDVVALLETLRASGLVTAGPD
jgi:PqqD family protein of HPr-rel-A system